jgi:hypothetical protein
MHMNTVLTAAANLDQIGYAERYRMSPFYLTPSQRLGFNKFS